MDSVKMEIRGTKRKLEVGRTKRIFCDNSKQDNLKKLDEEERKNEEKCKRDRKQ